VAERMQPRAVALFVVLLAGGLLLSACAGPRALQEAERNIELASGPQADAEVYSDLIQGMLDQQQFYAALAHIEQMRIESGDRPALGLFEGRALYGLGLMGQAEAAYRRLLRGPLDAEAHHGLGLVLSGSQPDRAIEHLTLAVRGRPTNVRMRNDLGFALTQAGRYRDARLQLATAVELAPDDNRARNNLVLLLLASGDEAGARSVARDAGIDERRLAQMRVQAERIRLGRAQTPISTP
jgi:Flp pilus assembly protein TadD